MGESQALEIRDVPDDVRQVLAEAARLRGQSLQVYLLALIADEAVRARNLERMRKFQAAAGERDAGALAILAEIARARAEPGPRAGPSAAVGP